MKKIFGFVAVVFCILISGQESKALKLKKYKVAALSDTLKETSGLTWHQGRLFTLNDGGNPNEYYEISPKTGEVLGTFSVDFNNEDWEALTSDGESLYIADIGNNRGTRKDLSIYKIGEKSSQIPFEYQNQKDFNPKNRRHNFDAEAIVFKDGKLHLFSKEWASKNTVRYEISLNKQEKQSLIKSEEFPVKFLVTDAAYFKNKLYLVGYNKKAKAFMLVFEEDENGYFFNGKYRKYRLGSILHCGQIEGVAVDDNGVHLSGEAFYKLGFKTKASLYFIPFEELN